MKDQTLPCNKLENVRRRAERAASGKTIESIVTCGASRHVMAIADALADKRKYPMMNEEPEYCAASLYSVLESLWKARTEIKRLVKYHEKEILPKRRKSLIVKQT